MTKAGVITACLDKAEGNDWDTAEIARTSIGDNLRLMIADLDNNGGLDLAVSSNNGTSIWLGDENQTLKPMRQPATDAVFSTLLTSTVTDVLIC